MSGNAIVKTQEPSSVNFDARGTLKLDELAGYLGAAAGPKVTSGTASFHVAGGGPLEKLKTDPLSTEARGEASINSVRVELSQPSPPLVLERANISLAGRSADITGVVARAGSSVFNASGRVSDWKERSVELEVSSPMIDLGELLLPAAIKQKAPTKKGGVMTARVGKIPAKGTAKFHAEKLKFGNFGASDLDAKVVFGGDSIAVTNVTMNTLGGKCIGKSRLALTSERPPAYSASFSADDLQMKELLNTLSPLKDFMSGLSFFQISVEGKFARDVSPLGGVVAKGEVRTTQARAIASPLVSGIASLVGLQKNDQYALKDFSTTFLVQDGRVILPQCRLEEKNSSWDFSGSTGFDGTLEYKVNVRLSQEYSKRTGSLKGLDQLLKDDQGRIVLDLVVGGTVKKPTFRWDTARMQQRAGEFLAGRIRGQLVPQTKKAEELKEKVRTELGSKSDTLKAEAATKGVKLLEDLLKKRKK